MTPAEANRRARAGRHLKRLMRWMVLVAVVVVVAVLGWLYATGTPLRLPLVLSVIAGFGLSVLVGTGLMLLSFYSDSSGHDADAGDRFKDSR